MSDSLYSVGKIVGTFGVRGDVKVLSQTDFPEERFRKNSKLIAKLPGTENQLNLIVESARPHKNVYLVHFKEIATMTDAEKLKDATLFVTEDQLIELPEDEYYFHEIMGCEVFSEDGERLGQISEILTPGANDVWVVERSSGKPLLIPFIKDVVLEVDVQQKKVTIHVMEGLL